MKNNNYAKSKFTQSLESATRKKIDNWLKELGWNTDEDSGNCNVCTERAKTRTQKDNLQGKKPDFVLYKSGSDEPIAIIEAKKKGQSIDKALEQGIKRYAKPLGVDIVFAIDGTFVNAFSVKHNKFLTIDGEPVRELLSEKRVLRFIEEGADIKETTEKVKHSREELIKIFKWANDLLRKEGLRNLDRFVQFSNILFIKIISEIEQGKEETKGKRELDKCLCWESFADMKEAKKMLHYINDTVLKNGFAEKYNHSDDIFQENLKIKNPETVKEIVSRLSKLTLLNTESEIKGDAFEYFLKNLVFGNDLGEYFTPRHIVKMMVSLIDPKFGDKVYDPACGTGGFLIEAFRHIKKGCNYEDSKIMHTLKEDSIMGIELTDTYKIAKMNMIITGDGHNNIFQGDCLAPESKIQNQYDVIITNPPYSQETDYGNLYPIPSKQADCIFIQHIILALKDGGKCAVIVPDGFLSEFKQLAFKKTRQWLLENCEIEAIISLPTGVFYPYAGAKTSILVFRKGKPTKRIWFFEISNDGFDLTIHRRPLKGRNDIDDLLAQWENKILDKKSFFVDVEDIVTNNYKLLLSEYKKFVISIKKFDNPRKIVATLKEINTRIKKKLSDIDKLLSYKKDENKVSKYRLKDIAKIETGGTPSTFKSEYWENGEIPWIRSGELKYNRIKDSEKKITPLGLKESNAKLFPINTVLIALTGATTGKTAILDIKAATNQSVTGIYPSSKFIPEYLWYYLRLNYEKIKNKSYGRAQQHIRQGIIEDLEVQLPDIETQRKIVIIFQELENLNEKYKILKKQIDDLFNSLLAKSIKL
jgi:type I restriction enzyme M protein